MTLSNPHKRIWHIAGPAILAGSATPLVGLVDTWAIGHLPSPTHLAAIAFGATVFSFIFWAFGFLRMGTTGMIAQAEGQNDKDRMARLLVQSAALALSIALLLLIFQLPIFKMALLALSPPDSVAATASPYYYIRIYTAPASLLYYILNGYFIGRGKTAIVLKLTLIMNGINAALNLFFVLILEMGVAGIALGSLIAEYSAVCIGVYIVIKQLSAARLLQAMRTHDTWQWAKIQRFASVNGSIFIRTLFLMTALSLVTREASTYGAVAMAASHVLMTFMMLISLGLDGFAYAAEALCGAAWGKKDRAEFTFWARKTSLWAVAISMLYGLGFYVFTPAIAAGLTDILSVQKLLIDMTPVIVGMPLLAVACYQFDGIFIGATAARAMMITMGLSFVGYLMLLHLFSGFGLAGIWWAVNGFAALRGLTQALFFPALLRRLPLNQ